MKLTKLSALFAAPLWLLVSCADDEGPSDPFSRGGTSGTGGSAGMANAGSSGAARGGSDGGGGSGSGAVGGAISCEPPSPPDVNGSAGSGGAGVEAGLSIVGNYVDNFNGQHVIENSTWMSSGSVFHIAAFSNANHYVIAQNDEANAFSACRWSRFDWAEAVGKLYYCQSVYDAVDEAAARRASPPDSSDLAGGCNGFSWSELSPE